MFLPSSIAHRSPLPCRESPGPEEATTWWLMRLLGSVLTVKLVVLAGIGGTLLWQFVLSSWSSARSGRAGIHVEVCDVFHVEAPHDRKRAQAPLLSQFKMRERASLRATTMDREALTTIICAQPPFWRHIGMESSTDVYSHQKNWNIAFSPMICSGANRIGTSQTTHTSATEFAVADWTL